MTQPGPHIFYDRRGTRWTRVKRAAGLALLVTSVLGTLLGVTLVLLPALPAGLLAGDTYFHPKVEPRERAEQGRLAAQARTQLQEDIRKEHGRRHPASKKPYSTVIGFYVNWEPNSFNSLREHADALTYLMPEWLSLTPDAKLLRLLYDTSTNDPKVVQLAADRHLPIIPLVNNVVAGTFDWPTLKLLLQDPARQKLLIQRLREYVESNHFAGINIDFEAPYYQLSDDERKVAQQLVHDALPDFMELLHKEFAPRHLLVTQDLQAADENEDLDALNDANDLLIIMLYDQHVAAGEPGPIASQTWVESCAEHVLPHVDSSKVIFGLGNYCYDWRVKFAADGTYTTPPGSKGRKLLLGAALGMAREAQAEVQMEDDDLNPFFACMDEEGQEHLVYMLDAVTAFNELSALRGYEARGAALWYLGSEDPTLWSFFDERKLSRPYRPDLLKSVDLSGHGRRGRGPGRQRANDRDRDAPERLARLAGGRGRPDYRRDTTAPTPTRSWSSNSMRPWTTRWWR